MLEDTKPDNEVLCIQNFAGKGKDYIEQKQGSIHINTY